MPVTWDPQVQQVADPDTTLLADLTDLAAINAQGGVLGSTSATPSQETIAATMFEWGAGKFTAGMHALAGGMLLSYPIDGLLDGEGATVEGWFKHDTLAWNAASSATLIALRGVTFYVFLRLNAGTMTLSAERYAGAPTGTAGRQSVATTGAISAGLAAATYYPAAITYDGTHLRAYLNGVQVGSALAFTMPDQLTDDARVNGLQIGGHSGASSGFWFSDIRVSTTGRAPGVPVEPRALDGTLAVDVADVDRAVSRNQIGTLLTPRVAGFDAAVVEAAVKNIRHAKFMHTTPIKVGGTDATHPTLGFSGAYSYDWQVVDRVLDEGARLGTVPYISLGDTPSILGGTNPPYSGTDLTSAMTEPAPNNKQVPNDMDAYETIVGDFVHHIVVTRGDPVWAWSAWNEPESSGFWAGTEAQWLDLHVRTARAIRVHDPTTPIAGNEAAGGTSEQFLRFTNLMDTSLAQSVDLDLLAYHDYSGDLKVFDQFVAAMNKYATDRSLAPLDAILGEFNWSSRHLHQEPPVAYFPQFYLHVMAFVATYTTAWLCNAFKNPQFYSVSFSHLNAYDGDPRAGGWNVSQLLGNNGEKWGPYNALKGFHLVLGDERLNIDTSTLGPGVYAYAGKRADGRVGLALANYGWANRMSRDVNVSLTGLTGDKRIRRYLVDPTHSSRWDTHEDAPEGAIHNDLELMSDTSGPAPPTLSLTLPQWSSTFVTIDPAEAGGGGGGGVPRIVKIDGQIAELP